MIKLLALLTRKEGLSHEQFVKHWYEIHAPLAHAVPGIRRYVQSHITGTRSRPDIPDTAVEVDGIAELWYDDAASYERAAASPEMHSSGGTLTAVVALPRRSFIARIVTGSCPRRRAQSAACARSTSG